MYYVYGTIKFIFSGREQFTKIKEILISIEPIHSLHFTLDLLEKSILLNGLLATTCLLHVLNAYNMYIF